MVFEQYTRKEIIAAISEARNPKKKPQRKKGEIRTGDFIEVSSDPPLKGFVASTYIGPEGRNLVVSPLDFDSWNIMPGGLKHVREEIATACG